MERGRPARMHEGNGKSWGFADGTPKTAWFLSRIPKLEYGKPYGVRRFIAAFGIATWLDPAACCREFHEPTGGCTPKRSNELWRQAARRGSRSNRESGDESPHSKTGRPPAGLIYCGSTRGPKWALFRNGFQPVSMRLRIAFGRRQLRNPGLCNHEVEAWRRRRLQSASPRPVPYPDLWRVDKSASAGPYRDPGVIQETSAKQGAEGPLHTSLGQRPGKADWIMRQGLKARSIPGLIS